MARPAPAVYGDAVVSSAVRSFLAEPTAPDPPARVWRDWVVLAVMATAAVLETIFREDLVWRPAGLVVCLALAVALLWRRTHPLLVAVIAFGGTTLLDTAAALFADETTDASMAVLFASAWLLLLPYALLRWGSGRDAAIGMGFILAANGFSEIVAGSIADLFLGMVFFLFPAALGASIRYRTGSRLRERDQVKLR
jgi:hypothetical protein